MTTHSHTPAISRRVLAGGGVAAGLAAGLASLPGRVANGQAATPAAATPVPTPDAAAITEVVTAGLAKHNARAALAQIIQHDQVLATIAVGESMTGIPATTDMRVRSGAVAIAWMATALLLLAEQGVLSIDDTIDHWLPDLPMSDQATLKMLTNMTSGYMDYVQSSAFVTAFYGNPFRAFTPQEQINYGLDLGFPFKPGTNWAYAHTGYVILGQVLELVAGQPLATTIRELVLDPLGLEATLAADDATLPDPVLHAFSGERRSFLGVPAGTEFMEESTFWNPSWTLAHGAIQSATISDMARSAKAFGAGTLLSPASRELMLGKHLVDFGQKMDGCPTCTTMTANSSYGMGVILVGDWIMQTPSFAGYGGTAAYLPAHDLAIATATTNTAAQYNPDGSLKDRNASVSIARELSALLAPDNPLGQR